MPVVAFALAAYLAGLLAGYSSSTLVCLGAVGAAAAFGHSRVRLIAVWFAALATAGIVVAQDARAHDDHCVAGALNGNGRGVRLVLEQTAAPGAFVRARLVGCD